MHQSARRRTCGQSIIETVVGIIFMIPIVLFLFDVAVLVLANTANDNLAKQAARAAASAVDPNNANQGTATVGQAAAQNTVNHFATSGFIDNVQFAYMVYNGSAVTVSSALGTPPALATNDPGTGNVAVTIAMEARAPVPFPGFNTQRVFWARAVEPIVALPPAP
ncbi:MAG TPA: hypothetical protein V6D22_21805 [Candidatus Obscuribacterales bacterium]